MNIDISSGEVYRPSMPAKATTVRIDLPIQAALENLSQVLKRPMNQLVNEAVKDFVERRSREVERDLEQTVARLRSYRRRDPHHKEAIVALAQAEASLGKDDPAQGRVVVGDLVDGRLVEKGKTEGLSPPQSEVRRLLNAS